MKSNLNLWTVAASAAASEMKRRYRSRKRPAKRAKRTARSAKRKRSTKTKTVTRRTRRRVYDNHATENRERSLKTYSRRLPLRSIVTSAFEPVWWRFQNVSQYDTSVGALCIAQRFNSTTGLRYPPCHVYDITCAPNVVDDALTPVAPGLALTQTVPGVCSFTTLPGQSANGTASGGNWEIENSGQNPGTGANQPEVPHRKGIHEHTTVQLNLYGVRKRATKWLVELMMVKDEFADFISADGNNTQKKKLYDYLCRPFIYSNLLSAEPQTAGMVKVLKRYTVTIAPTTTDEYGGQAAAVPHMQTLRWYIKHNRLRRFDWQREAPAVGLTPSAAWDQQSGATDSTRIYPTKRVYLVLRAMSPEAVTSTTVTPAVVADPISEPSYDIVLRNKWQFPM